MSGSEGRMSEAEDAVELMIVASWEGIITTLWSLKEAPLGVDDMAADGRCPGSDSVNFLRCPLLIVVVWSVIKRKPGWKRFLMAFL